MTHDVFTLGLPPGAPERFRAHCWRHGITEFRWTDPGDWWICGEFFAGLNPDGSVSCGTHVPVEAFTPDGGSVWVMLRSPEGVPFPARLGDPSVQDGVRPVVYTDRRSPHEDRP